MRTGALRLQPVGLGVGGGVYEVDAQFGAVHEDVHSRQFFGPPKDGRGRVIDLPAFPADLLAETAEAAEVVGEVTPGTLDTGFHAAMDTSVAVLSAR